MFQTLHRLITITLIALVMYGFMTAVNVGSGRNFTIARPGQTNAVFEDGSFRFDAIHVTGCVPLAPCSR